MGACDISDIPVSLTALIDAVKAESLPREQIEILRHDHNQVGSAAPLGFFYSADPIPSDSCPITILRV
jgi:hypothetical protein